MRIAVLASGRGSNLQTLIDAVESGNVPAEIEVVVSDKPESKALQRASIHGIETAVFPGSDFADRKSFDLELKKFLEKKKIDLVCLAGFMRILGPDFVSNFFNRIINIHPSLLPSFPGLNAQQQALDYGVKFSGCTVHFVDEGMDTGPIIGQRIVPVLENDTVETLSARILDQEHELYPIVVKQIALGKVKVCGRKVFIEGGESFEEGAGKRF